MLRRRSTFSIAITLVLASELRPARAQQALGASPSGATLAALTPTCPGFSTTTASFAGTTGAIPPGGAQFTVQVSGLGAFLWDVDVSTALTHPDCGEFDLFLTSPAGTTVTLSTDNGDGRIDVFDGTVWDDNVNDPVTDRSYTNWVTATPLSPEGRLSGLRGEDPSGTWTLTVLDDASGNLGALASWSLEVEALAASPPLTTTTLMRAPGLFIPDQAYMTDALTFAGQPAHTVEVSLYLEITHTWSGDLDISLISPAGTSVIVTNDNGGAHNNAFNGTLFDVDVLDPVTDHVFGTPALAAALSPQGSFDNFFGQDPNGVWTLRVADDVGGDVGWLQRWSLTIASTDATPTPTQLVLGGAGSSIPDPGPVSVAFTALVSGVGSYLWDLDLTTFLRHSASADLDLRLTSPAGTTIALSTDNGDALDDVFNGTLWDDDVNAPVTDYVFADQTVATPLSPEGRLSAFRGEDPSGVWTLDVTDDTTGDGGFLSAWTLDVRTQNGAPNETTAVFSASPGAAIPDPGTLLETQVVSGLAAHVQQVELYLKITHTQPGDLDITLTSPAGTIVTVTTDNGGTANHVFNGTTFDPRAVDAVSDYPYVNQFVVPLLSPEGSFDNFAGQDPNGVWKLSVRDDQATDVGVLQRWDLVITTCDGAPVVGDCQLLPTATQGCSSSVGWSGAASATSSSPFTLTFGGLNAQVNGVVFYGLSGPNNVAWSAESNLCVKTPTQRLGGVAGAFGGTGGALGSCNGAYSFDMNAVIQGSGLLGTPMASGQAVDVQAWQRDPASSKTTNLTDAVRIVVGP